MPGFNPFRYRFPYTNLNDINLDWLIKKVRKLSEDVAAFDPERIEEVAQQAATAEQTAQNALETAEGVSGIANDAVSIARAAQTTANNAADSAQAAGTAAAVAQTTANNAADSAQAAGTAAAVAQTTANNAADSAQAAGTAAAAAQTTANQNSVAIAIVANGNTAPQNISVGQYVLWNGALYIASVTIASGATLSNSNLTSVSNGGLNSLRAEFHPCFYNYLRTVQIGTVNPGAYGSGYVDIPLAQDQSVVALIPQYTNVGVPVAGVYFDTATAPSGYWRIVAGAFNSYTQAQDMTATFRLVTAKKNMVTTQ